LSKEERNWLKKLNESVYPPDVEAECPRWLFDKVGDMALLKSLNEPASADLRVNRGSRESVLQKLRGEGLYFAPTPYSPIGIRSSERVNLNNCIAYREGEIEVQDEASQLAAILCDVRPEHKVVDYCAGAGGKSLAIASLSGGRGKIEAHDVDWRRLEQIKPRLERLNIKNVEPVREVKSRDYDRFIIDAPCSGTGTWRRSPDAKFRLTPPMVKIQSFNQTGQIILVQPFDNLADMDFVVFVQSDNDGINHLLTDTVLNLLTLLFAGKFSLFFNFGAG
jgi:16S rRNA (cytosine967-C5)-methyltransferase